MSVTRGVVRVIRLNRVDYSCALNQQQIILAATRTVQYPQVRALIDGYSPHPPGCLVVSQARPSFLFTLVGASSGTENILSMVRSRCMAICT